MAEYCTATDVQNRLTEAGYKFAVDRSGNGTISVEEIAASVTPQIAWAGNLIDGMLVNAIQPSEARAQANAWLRDRATDLAAYRVATNGGRKAPASLKEDYDRAYEMLVAVREGAIVPGLTYPDTTGAGSLAARIPTFINPWG